MAVFSITVDFRSMNSLVRVCFNVLGGVLPVIFASKSYDFANQLLPFIII